MPKSAGNALLNSQAAALKCTCVLTLLLLVVLPVPSPVGAPPRMTRSNSIPTQDASMELYGASPLGSTLSLAERPRSMGMVRSGSFRDKDSDESESPPPRKWQKSASAGLCWEPQSGQSVVLDTVLLVSFQSTAPSSPWCLTPRPATPR